VIWHDEYAHLFVALALGMAVGWERSLEGKPAGYRTHALVALGAAGLILAARAALGDDPVAKHSIVHVVAGVITGIGFLGAGAILQGERTVKGLTTAATIWIVAAIGVVCGFGQIVLALLMAALAWVVLQAFVKLEDMLFDRPVRNAEGKHPEPAPTGKPTDAED
jgi:putative Mg2+ transporter-C (MgtC) family protein